MQITTPLQSTVDTFQNQDKTLKESFSLFKGGSLEFLDADLAGEVTEVLNIEITETTTKKAYADNALKLSSNKGIHSEWEAEINKEDMMRFASYNIDLSRMHGIDFTTVIITTKKPSVTSYENPSVSFKPKIINLKERDADKVLEDIDEKLKTGEPINELVLIYLPLYGSKSGKTVPELLDAAIKLTTKAAKDNRAKKIKLQDLLILLTSSFVTDEELKRVSEENMRILEDNRAVRVLQDMGRSKRDIEIAVNMLKDGDSIQKIVRITGLDEARVVELQNGLQLREA